MYHRWRAFLAEFGSDAGVAMKDKLKVIPFHTHTLEQQAAKKAAMNHMRQQMKAAYLLAVECCSKFEPYEVLERDATNG